MEEVQGRLPLQAFLARADGWWNLLGGFGHVCGRLKIECLASEADLLLAQLALLHAVPQRELCTCSYDVLRNTGLAFRQPRQVGGRCLDKLDNQ